MDMYVNIVGFFRQGGIFMYPIVAVLAVGVAIALERYLYLTFSKRNNHKLWNQLQPLLKKGDYKSAYDITARSKHAISQVMSYGLTRMSTAKRRDDIELAIEEGMMEIIPRLEKRTHYLATFANIATLLGLLGTIIGLIQTFTAVSNADPAQKADLLSSSISVAMNTTAFGLIVAIPLRAHSCRIADQDH